MQVRGRLRRIHWIVGGIICLLLASGVVTIAVLRTSPPTATPSAIAHIKAFEPYYFISGVPEGFSLKEESVSFSNDVLFFQLEHKEKNQQVTVTEQLLPNAISTREYPNAEQVPGADGHAFIQYDGSRAMGGLVSTKRNNRQTFIIISSVNPLQQRTLEELLRGLRPSSVN